VRTSRYPTFEEDNDFPISISLKESDTTFEVSQAEVSALQDTEGETKVVVSEDTFNQRFLYYDHFK